MYITDSTSQLGHNWQTGKIVFLWSRLKPVIRRCGVVAVSEVDTRDLVETVCEGLLVLDCDLTIRFANRSFCDTFAVAPEDAVGQRLYELGNRGWNIPELRTALETVVSGGKSIGAFQVDRFFPSIGRRAMVLNARKVYRLDDKIQRILLAVEDVTGRVRLEHEHAIADERIGMLLQELTHRVKNNLQIVAAMVSMEYGASINRSK
jgi:PAS domain S-box-containing protein